MLKDDAYTRWNRAHARQERMQRIKDGFMAFAFLALFVLVVWDCGHYEPPTTDKDTTKIYYTTTTNH